MTTVFVGLHQPSDAWRFPRCMLSINRFRGPKGRRAPLPALGVEVWRRGLLLGTCILSEWWLDSAAFTEIMTYGGYRQTPEEFAAEIAPLCDGRLRFVSTQDYMCEPEALAKTGLTIADHQRLTIERFVSLKAALAQLVAEDRRPAIVPVLQGWTPDDYVAHLRAYGDLIPHGAHVGVGSVCKRQGSPSVIKAILRAIKAERPDLKLHGFGVKLTAMSDPEIRDMLETVDSLAWSFHARKNGRNANDWRYAKEFVDEIELRCAA